MSEDKPNPTSWQQKIKNGLFLVVRTIGSSIRRIYTQIEGIMINFTIDLLSLHMGYENEEKNKTNCLEG